LIFSVKIYVKLFSKTGHFTRGVYGFLDSPPVDNSKTIALSIAGILFAVEYVHDEQLKHAGESKYTAHHRHNSARFFNPLPADA
jgi:hypothetical protein